jgi:hypothetical protein
MLSSILNSKTAIEVNIQVIRVFNKMREYALTHEEILLQLAKLEEGTKRNSKDIENIFAVLKELIKKQNKPAPPRQAIGFKTQATKNAHSKKTTNPTAKATTKKQTKK